MDRRRDVVLYGSVPIAHTIMSLQDNLKDKHQRPLRARVLYDEESRVDHPATQA